MPDESAEQTAPNPFTEPLVLNVTFTNDMLDNNRALGQMLRKISQFFAKSAARYIVHEKCDIHHPVMTTLLNTSVGLRQAGDMADPPVVLGMPPGGVPMPRRAN